MDAKTIVAVVLVAFIIGGFIFLQIKNRKKYEINKNICTRFRAVGGLCRLSERRCEAFGKRQGSTGAGT